MKPFWNRDQDNETLLNTFGRTLKFFWRHLTRKLFPKTILNIFVRRNFEFCFFKFSLKFLKNLIVRIFGNKRMFIYFKIFMVLNFKRNYINNQINSKLTDKSLKVVFVIKSRANNLNNLIHFIYFYEISFFHSFWSLQKDLLPIKNKL